MPDQDLETRGGGGEGGRAPQFGLKIMGARASPLDPLNVPFCGLASHARFAFFLATQYLTVQKYFWCLWFYLFDCNMVWRCQICTASFLFSYRDDLSDRKIWTKQAPKNAETLFPPVAVCRLKTPFLKLRQITQPWQECIKYQVTSSKNNPIKQILPRSG